MLDVPDIFESVLDSAADEIRAKLSNKNNVNEKDDNELTCLHISCSIGNDEITELLIKYGADINAKDKNRWTPLMKACSSNHFKIVKLLLNNNVDVNCADNKLRRALHICAAENSVECLAELLPLIKCINITDCDGRSAVHYAALNGNIEVMRLLLDNEASLNLKDQQECRPLHWAVSLRKLDMVNFLLDQGSSVTWCDKSDYTPLHIACTMGDREIVQTLIDHGSELDAVTDEGNTPLHLACASKRIQVIQELISAINSPHLFLQYLRNNNLQKVSEIPEETLTKLMRAHTVKLVNQRNRHGLTPLLIILQHGKLFDVVSLLLNNGADPSIKCEAGRNAIHYAVMKHELRNLRLLLENNDDVVIDINVQDNKDNTPIHYAAKLGYDTILTTLLSLDESGNSNNSIYLMPGEEGRLPIHLAAAYGHEDCFNRLLDNLIRIRPVWKVDTDSFNRNLLHLAVVGGSLNIMKALLVLRVSYKEIDSSGMSCLHLAARLNRFKMCGILIKLGLIFTMPDEHGCTPIHYAAMYNDDATILNLFCEVNESAFMATILHPTKILDPVNYLDPLLENATVDMAIDNAADVKLVYPVHFAAQTGNVIGMKYLLEKMPRQYEISAVFGGENLDKDNQSRDDQPENYSTSNSESILSIVCLAAYNDQFKVLSNCFRNYSSKISEIIDKNGRSPLHFAAYQGHQSIIKFLLSIGAKLSMVDHDYCWNPMHYAASQGHASALVMLLNHPSIGVAFSQMRENFVNSPDEHHRTLLMLAAQNGQFEVCDKLVSEFHADVNCADTYARTALHRAVSNGHTDIVELLLTNEADIGSADFRGRSAIHMAATAGNFHILSKLIDYLQQSCMASNQLTPRNFDQDKDPDYWEAVQREKSEAYFQETLMSLWFDQNQYTPLHFAASKGYHECVEYLLRFTNVKDYWDNQKADLSILHCAVESKSEKTVNCILKSPAGSALINCPDANRWTPLFYVCCQDNVPMLKQLIKFSSLDLNFPDSQGRTALLIAALYGSLGCLKILLSSECSTTLRWAVADSRERNVLHWSALARSDETGQFILTSLPNVATLLNSRDKFNRTPAYIAVKYGLLGYLNHLIKMGANLFSVKTIENLPILAPAQNNKVTNCMIQCLVAMFPKDSNLQQLRCDTNINTEHSILPPVEHNEMEGSVQSSENEYF